MVRVKARQTNSGGRVKHLLERWYQSHAVERDGVGDNSDAFPNDASKWEEESSDDSPFLGIPLLIISVMISLLFIKAVESRTRTS